MYCSLADRHSIFPSLIIMVETKQLKIVYDGQGYWLLWRWENPWFPDNHLTQQQLPRMSGYYQYVTGPFESLPQAENAITERVIAEGWKLIPFFSEPSGKTLPHPKSPG